MYGSAVTPEGTLSWMTGIGNTAHLFELASLSTPFPFALPFLTVISFARSRRGNMTNELAGPAEITVFHPAVYQAIDGPGNRNIRSDWYDLLYPRISSIFTRDRELHDVRRRVWTHALSSAGKRIIQKPH